MPAADYATPSLSSKIEAVMDALRWASAHRVRWLHGKDVPRAREAGEPWLELSILSIHKAGQDEPKKEFNESTGEQNTYRIGQRILLLQVDVRSRYQDLDQSAWLLAENTRTRIEDPYAVETWLGAADLSIAGTTDVLDMPGGYIHDGRTEDVAHFELHLNTFVSNADAGMAASDWIENAEVSSNFKNAGGEPLDDSLQLDKEVM